MKLRRRYGPEYPGLLLLSATGPDTAVKSVRATLYQPDIEAEFVLESERIERMLKARIAFDGKPVTYTAAVTKLAPGVIHLVALAKIPGLMPNMSDDHLWAELTGPRYTTPLLRAWIPWLKEVMAEEGWDCCCQRLCSHRRRAEDRARGIGRPGHVGRQGRSPAHGGVVPSSRNPMMNCETLQEYLDRYGALVADRARQAFEPLHVPATDSVVRLDLKRPMLPAQAHVVTAAVKTLDRQKAVFLCCECGTGKSQMGACTVHAHAAGKPYRAIVMCPPHLVETWRAELRQVFRGRHDRNPRLWKSGGSCSPIPERNQRSRLGSSWARRSPRTAPSGGQLP